MAVFDGSLPAVGKTAPVILDSERHRIIVVPQPDENRLWVSMLNRIMQRLLRNPQQVMFKDIG